MISNASIGSTWGWKFANPTEAAYSGMDAPFSNDPIGVEGNAENAECPSAKATGCFGERPEVLQVDEPKGRVKPDSRNQARHGVAYFNTTRVPRRNVMTVAGGLQHRTATGRADALKKPSRNPETRAGQSIGTFFNHSGGVENRRHAGKDGARSWASYLWRLLSPFKIRGHRSGESPRYQHKTATCKAGSGVRPAVTLSW